MLHTYSIRDGVTLFLLSLQETRNHLGWESFLQIKITRDNHHHCTEVQPIDYHETRHQSERAGERNHVHTTTMYRANAMATFRCRGKMERIHKKRNWRNRCYKEENAHGESLQGMKRAMEAAVEREDYAEAARLRDAIENRFSSDVVAVEQANLRFYRAFESGDMERMKNVWSKGDHIKCIHPGAGCVSGREDVMASWDVVLRGIMIDINVLDVQVHSLGSCAFVTCIEDVDAGESKGRLVATNIFELESDGEWYMVHHHASSFM